MVLTPQIQRCIAAITEISCAENNLHHGLALYCLFKHKRYSILLAMLPTPLSRVTTATRPPCMQGRSWASGRGAPHQAGRWEEAIGSSVVPTSQGISLGLVVYFISLYSGEGRGLWLGHASARVYKQSVSFLHFKVKQIHASVRGPSRLHCIHLQSKLLTPRRSRDPRAPKSCQSPHPTSPHTA